jgi:NhaP-type Na+/H+ or K+/H+ antiporter
VTWQKIFAAVTVSALIGMAMGALFGLAAGGLAPDFFRHLIPWQDVAPRGFAILLGATAGVLLGGALGCFGIAVQMVLHWRVRDTAGK